MRRWSFRPRVVGGVTAEVREAWFRRVRLRTGAQVEDRTFRFDLTPAPLEEGPAWAPSPTQLLGTADAPAVDGAHGTATDEKGGDETGPLLEAYLVATTHAALVEVLGRSAFHASDLLRRVHAESAALAFSALELLARHGLASESAGLWTLQPEHGFGDAAAVWRTLSAEAPALNAELALAADTAAALPGLLRAGPAAQSRPLPPPSFGWPRRCPPAGP